jgi:hypothetical protein
MMRSMTNSEKRTVNRKGRVLLKKNTADDKPLVYDKMFDHFSCSKEQ